MSKKVYFQIGTNDGNDEFRKKVILDNPNLVILVEPNTELIQTIKNNYSNINNVVIYNNAIYNNSNEEVELYIPAKNAIYGTRADNGHTYSHVNYSLVPMNDWGDKKDMVKIKTKTITFEDICRLNNITEIDYLQIDTEGFDSEIIKMINFNKYKINTIRFEKWYFSSNCFSKYNDNLILGQDGMKESLNKLLFHNYEIKDIRDNDGDDHIATLKK